MRLCSLPAFVIGQVIGLLICVGLASAAFVVPNTPGGWRIPMRPVGPDLVSDMVNDGIDTPQIPVVLIYDIELTWSRPTTRTDTPPTPLSESEISGYVINHNGVEYTLPPVLTWTILAPGSGTHTISIATVDSSNQRGPFSLPISVVVP